MRRVWAKDVKGYVYVLAGVGGHRLAFPKSAPGSGHVGGVPAAGLGLRQPYLVFQVFVPNEAHVSLEIGFSDDTNVRRRIVLSTSFTEVRSRGPGFPKSRLPSRVPILVLLREQYL